MLQEITAVSNKVSISEIIYVDDASMDRTFSVLEAARQDMPLLRVIRHSGQSAAFMSGIRTAENSLIVLMEGDGQHDPDDIEKLYDCYIENTLKYKKLMIAGQRLKRQDNNLRRISSKLTVGFGYCTRHYRRRSDIQCLAPCLPGKIQNHYTSE